MLAQVKLSTGRLYLEVGGIIVAVEADPCRDPNEPFVFERTWNQATLEEAARRINERTHNTLWNA